MTPSLSDWFSDRLWTGLADVPRLRRFRQPVLSEIGRILQFAWVKSICLVQFKSRWCKWWKFYFDFVQDGWKHSYFSSYLDSHLTTYYFFYGLHYILTPLKFAVQNLALRDSMQTAEYAPSYCFLAVTCSPLFSAFCWHSASQELMIDGRRFSTLCARPGKIPTFQMYKPLLYTVI